MITYAYQNEKPTTNANLTDAYGSPLKIGDNVIFNLSGTLAYGKVKEVKKFDWEKSAYYEKHKKPEHKTTWHFKCVIKIELIKNSPSGQLVGHISTVKNIDGILKYI